MTTPYRKNCYQVLGVERHATTETIRRAYTRLKTIFEPDNPTLYGLYDEADAHARLGQIRHAYRVLLDPTSRQEHDHYLFPDESIIAPHSEGESTMPESEAAVSDTAMAIPDDFQPPTPGRMLKSARQRVGLSLEDIADRTKIAVFTLRSVEAERYGDLPAPVYVRGFLKQIVDMVRIDDTGLVDEYIRRFEAWIRSRTT